MRTTGKSCFIWSFKWAALYTASGCTQKEDPLPTVHITLQLKWVHQTRFDAFYATREKGYYADKRLQVDFLDQKILERSLKDPTKAYTTEFLERIYSPQRKCISQIGVRTTVR